jgi:hypothetical protein
MNVSAEPFKISGESEVKDKPSQLLKCKSTGLNLSPSDVPLHTAEQSASRHVVFSGLLASTAAEQASSFSLVAVVVQEAPSEGNKVSTSGRKYPSCAHETSVISPYLDDVPGISRRDSYQQASALCFLG